MKKGYGKSKSSVAKAYQPDTFKEKPSLRIEESELPALKNWKVDGEYYLNVKVKLTNLGRSEYEKNPQIWASFRVESVSEDTDHGSE